MNKMFELTVLITECLWPRCAIKSCLGSTQLIFGITVCIAQVSLGVSGDFRSRKMALILGIRNKG